MKIIFERYHWLLDRARANDTSAQALCNRLISLVAMHYDGLLDDDEFIECLTDVLEDK